MNTLRNSGSRDYNKSMADFEIIDVRADVGLIAYGKELKTAFENAVMGMFSIMIETETIIEKDCLNVEVRAENIEDLLVAWLNELIYLFETKGFVPAKCNIKELSETHLRAKVFGEGFSSEKHRPKTIVKAATYHGLEIKKDDSSYRIKVILDV